MCIVQFVAERNPWSEEELRFLQHKFQHLERPPNFPEIRMAMRSCTSLRNRTLPQIKTRVWALISKKK